MNWIIAIVKGLAEGFFNFLKKQHQEKKASEAEALKGRANSVEESKDLEAKIKDKQREDKEDKSNEKDVFGSDDWNAGS